MKSNDNSFNSWTGEKNIVKISEYFTKTKSLGGNVKVELDLSNYATKRDLKKGTGVDTPKFDKKVDLARLKSEINK